MKSLLTHIIGFVDGVAFTILFCACTGLLTKETVVESVEVTRGLRQVSATVTAYCPCERCCGKYADGITATGRDAFKTRGVAVDGTLIKKGSKVTIPGVGTYLADDVGGAMRQFAKKGLYHIDLRFPTHEEALQWGRKHIDILVQDKVD